ncbi:hypothetical protein PBI_PERCIVAL_65 [Microbacterium phage Percival]|uniref:Uncharacterized protein n=1 Tax=Microbacterium phage Percival TaxID=2201439 RepID=A0A2Z4Q6T7_9CAUD|nr:hypothetical protein PBI_PERCIVAL_65 [Microbacterium phage Percival]
MSAASAARSGVRRFGDLPRRDQLAVYLRSASERLDQARSGFVRRPRRPGGPAEWLYLPETAARRVEHYEARVEALLGELADDILARLEEPPTPTPDDLEAAHWEALTAERDALAAKLAAVEQLADRWDRQHERYRAQAAYGAAGVLTRTTTQLREAIA